jgi:heme/copper-type cytochrome/quinol oxidase subunit 2
MSTSAFILMVLVQGTVIVLTTYFLIKVLRMPPKTNSDSEGENSSID